ncbi:MAG: hypothetical protein SF187_07385 [Deltaproteobacteria bacterium]|nr:hypothetical protein [Deltaproteobacteria bacterium]
MKRIEALLIALLSFPLVAADGGGGCGEHQPGNGDSRTWTTGVLPQAEGTPQPMSAPWLSGPNCWKDLVAAAQACLRTPQAFGAFDERRQTCSLSGGGRLELAGPISTPAEDSRIYVATDWRLWGPHGRVCVTGKLLAANRSVVDVEGKSALFESSTLTAYGVTCPDGRTFRNDIDGVDPTFGALWLAGRAPGVVFECKGKTCTMSLKGGAAGDTPIASCQ